MSNRMTDSLHGLRVGDALGSQFFRPELGLAAVAARKLPPAPWQWTDDTEMACAVVRNLTTNGRVEQDDLAHLFARHHDFDRGYGPATGRMLRLVREGGDWRSLSLDLFDGQGSWGNGAAMRVAPLGAFFAGDLHRAADEAQMSAAVTHAHPDAQDGAAAVAVASSLAAMLSAGSETLAPREFLDAVLQTLPPGPVHNGVWCARGLAGVSNIRLVVVELGNGRRTSAADTVPIALWAAARHLDDYESAIWEVASAGGDVDTTCAITGGIVAANVGVAGIPAQWLEHTEALPDW